MRFEEAVKDIIDQLTRQLPAQLTYHSIHHIKDVYQTAKAIARQEGLSENDTHLLLTAASYHDAGFLKHAQGHEEESCRMAKAALPAYGYTSHNIEQICAIIMATRIPQTPHNLVEQILADADLDYLGRDDFFSIGNQLFTELKTAGTIHTELEWNRMQVKFMEAHHYFTGTSKRLRDAKKEANLALVKAKIN
ncbi:HD domain-containing protein [Mucilaginibacter sp. CSA2-8R]|uniref:HD domain-containing protein n=1 Tax=Mucilaginibacter sp. CSA2-8R TaxID=3141542 RepID=UPI00315CE3AF